MKIEISNAINGDFDNPIDSVLDSVEDFQKAIELMCGLIEIGYNTSNNIEIRITK